MPIADQSEKRSIGCIEMWGFVETRTWGLRLTLSKKFIFIKVVLRLSEWVVLVYRICIMIC